MNRSLTLLACVLTMAVVGCGSKGPSDAVVATVNGEPITREEYLRYMMLKPTVRVAAAQTGAVNARVIESLGLQTLEDLVRQRLLEQHAKSVGSWPTKEEIEQELRFREQMQPNFVRELTERGLTIDMIREVLALDLAREKILSKGIVVTPAEVDVYIKEHPDEFRTPPLADVYWIMARSEETKKQADDDLRRGQMFQVVAERYSEAEGARQQRGRFPTQRVDQMPEELKQIVASTPELRATEWKKLREGWAKFYIERKVASRPVEINALMRERLRRRIAVTRGQMANDLSARIDNMLRESDVQVKIGGLDRGWKRYTDRLVNASRLQAPLAPAGTQSPASTGGQDAQPKGG